jgi:uncharacterized protein YndB with AHSA1/START domain
MATHTLETAIDAPREIVFDVFANRERWHEFMPLRVQLIEPGVTDRQGVGAVWSLGVGPIGSVREQITQFVPNEAITYAIVGGAPVRRHIGSITFADDPRGTLVSYTMESEPSVPLPRVILTLGLRLAIATMVRRGAHAARERQHS